MTAMPNHYGHPDKAQVSLDFWLIIRRGDPKKYGSRPNVRVTAQTPNLARDERAMRLLLNLPMSLFETPALSAKINVGDPSVPFAIDLEAAAAALRGALGVDIDLRVGQADEVAA